MDLSRRYCFSTALMLLLTLWLSSCQSKSTQGKPADQAFKQCMAGSSIPELLDSLFYVRQAEQINACAERIEKVSFGLAICEVAHDKLSKNNMIHLVEKSLFINQVSFSPRDFEAMQNLGPGLDLLYLPVKAQGKYFGIAGFFKSLAQSDKTLWVESATIEVEQENRDWLRLSASIAVPSQTKLKCRPLLSTEDELNGLFSPAQMHLFIKDTASSLSEGARLTGLSAKAGRASVRIHLENDKGMESFIQSMTEHGYHLTSPKNTQASELNSIYRDLEFSLPAEPNSQGPRIDITESKPGGPPVSLDINFFGYDKTDLDDWAALVANHPGIKIESRRWATLTENHTRLKLSYSFNDTP